MAAAETAPFLLLQLSDCHLGADWDGPDPDRCLTRAVEAALALPQRPDALLVSGDLADDGAASSYARVRELLAPLGLEPHVVPGNHDERRAMRAAFGVPGSGAEPVSHVADLGPLRLVCVDSSIPGEEAGSLDEGRLAWLEEALAADRDTPTVVAMHHPPLHTAMPAFERIGLATADREALADLLSRNPQVLRLVAGHVHRTIVGDLAGRAAVTAPSTYVQTVPDFLATGIDMSDSPPGFLLHVLRDGALATHVQTVPGFEIPG